MRKQMMAAALCAAVFLPQCVGAETPASVHQYQSLALSAKGDIVAAVEGDEQRDSYDDLRDVVVMRNRATDAVLAKFDPCDVC